MYLEPAVRRAEEFEKNNPTPGPGRGQPLGSRKNRNGKPGGSGPDYEPGTPGHRKQIIEQAFMGTMGMKREAAERLYERQLAEWQATQKGES